MGKKNWSETDVCEKRISPAIANAGWDLIAQVLREYTLRAGRVMVRGNTAFRDKNSILRADYVLFHKPNVPLAVVGIVTLVTALRRLCADLRQRLAERQSVQARLAGALVETACFSSEPF